MRQNGSVNGVPTRPRGNWPQRRKKLMRLMQPGVGLKRWGAIAAVGVAVTSIGFAFLLRKLFDLRFPDFLPWYSEGFLLLGFGAAVILAAMYGLYRTLSSLLWSSQPIEELADTIYNRWSRGRGPKIVAIGGGTGLSVLLRGLRHHTDNLTAIITVADDGGSSGRLRSELGVLPPGDFRNCLVAMSEAESVLTDLFQYRFEHGDGLKGHSFGNLFIVAMSEITNSFEQALAESSRVLAVHGQVLPATLANLKLRARFTDGEVVDGESHIADRRGEIDRLFIDPVDAHASPMAIEAIEQSDLVVIGPGSLYTSILPNLLVRGIADALSRSSAPRMYVCNVATEMGETQGFCVADHLATLQRHTFASIADFVIANNMPRYLGPGFEGQPVVSDGKSLIHAELVLAELIDSDHPVRHDAEKLAHTVLDVGRRARRNGGALSSAVK